MFHPALDFHRVSLTDSVTLNDRETNDKKAKDWDVLELFYKMDRVEVEKVHNLRFGQGIWRMFGGSARRAVARTQ